MEEESLDKSICLSYWQVILYQNPYGGMMRASVHEILSGQSKLPHTIDFVMSDQQVIDKIDKFGNQQGDIRWILDLLISFL